MQHESDNLQLNSYPLPAHVVPPQVHTAHQHPQIMMRQRYHGRSSRDRNRLRGRGSEVRRSNQSHVRCPTIQISVLRRVLWQQRSRAACTSRFRCRFSQERSAVCSCASCSSLFFSSASACVFCPASRTVGIANRKCSILTEVGSGGKLPIHDIIRGTKHALRCNSLK